MRLCCHLVGSRSLIDLRRSLRCMSPYTIYLIPNLHCIVVLTTYSSVVDVMFVFRLRRMTYCGRSWTVCLRAESCSTFTAASLSMNRRSRRRRRRLSSCYSANETMWRGCTARPAGRLRIQH